MKQDFKATLSFLQKSITCETAKTKEISATLSANGLTEKEILNFLSQLQKAGYRISKGLYHLYNVVEETTTVQVSKQSNIVAATKDAVTFTPIQRKFAKPSDDYLIPKINPNYVKFGNYEHIERVLSTNKFAPIWVTGLSGNGKTYSAEQACANLKRKMVLINITNETNEEDLIGSFSLETMNSYEVDCEEDIFAEFQKWLGNV